MHMQKCELDRCTSKTNTSLARNMLNLQLQAARYYVVPNSMIKQKGKPQKETGRPICLLAKTSNPFKSIMSLLDDLTTAQMEFEERRVGSKLDIHFQ